MAPIGEGTGSSGGGDIVLQEAHRGVSDFGAFLGFDLGGVGSDGAVFHECHPQGYLVKQSTDDPYVIDPTRSLSPEIEWEQSHHRHEHEQSEKDTHPKTPCGSLPIASAYAHHPPHHTANCGAYSYIAD